MKLVKYYSILHSSNTHTHTTHFHTTKKNKKMIHNIFYKLTTRPMMEGLEL